MIRILFAFIFFFTYQISNGQESSQQGDILLLHLDYGYQLPGGDLKDRFGNSFKLSIGFDYQLDKSNILVGLEGGIQFGNQVKEDVLSTLRSPIGDIIGINQSLANVELRQRGLYVGGHLGKIISLSETNPRSGIRLSIGLGLLQHRIRLQDNSQSTPQLQGEYKKGYDRLTNGLAFQEFIGYHFLSPNRHINFIVGVEFTQAFTQNRRNADFNTRRLDDQKRKDYLLGFKVGWVLPFYIDENPDLIFY